jgi:hypothetical protein
MRAQSGVVKCMNRFVIICGYVWRFRQRLRKASGAEMQTTAILLTADTVNKMVNIARNKATYFFLGSRMAEL